MSTQKSFIDYYNENQLIPVKQDLKSKAEHFSKRDFLYSSVGLSRLALKNASILEFGPGTGQNAINWLNYNPSSITLVDGADAAIEEVKNFSEVDVPCNIDLSVIKVNLRHLNLMQIRCYLGRGLHPSSIRHKQSNPFNA